MIQANELRIGNWVQLKSDISGQLKNIQVDSEWFMSEADQRLSEPIPLTPEILEKCGFVVVKSGWYKKNYFTDCNEAVEEMQISYNIFTGRCGIGDADNDWGTAMLGKTFTSLHQLQNLYFALTGTELIINL